jgi:two-component system response regulator MprA
MRSTKVILVVDDDPSIQDALQDALEDEGYVVVLAGNGAQALDKLRGGCVPHAILLDYMMPVMDGPTFAAEACKDPSLAHLPIILVTADTRADEKAFECRLKAFLRKPLDLHDLLDTIEAV